MAFLSPGDTIRTTGFKAEEQILKSDTLSGEARGKHDAGSSGTPQHGEQYTARRDRQHGYRCHREGRGGFSEHVKRVSGQVHITLVDEAGMLYGLLPKKTYLAPGEKRKTVRGMNQRHEVERPDVGVHAHECNGLFQIVNGYNGKANKPRC